jgi:hypothetical protein
VSLVPKLPQSVPVPEELAFVVPVAVSAADAERTAREAILGSVLRPADIRAAVIEPMVLVHLPFWRVEVAADGFHLGIAFLQGGRRGSMPLPIPTGGARHRDGVMLVVARTLFPYEPSMLAASSGWVGTQFEGAMGAFQIRLEEMVPRAKYVITEGEIIDADIDRARAEREAKDRILRAVRPHSAVFESYEPKVKSVAFCHVPLYVMPYHYDGVAKRRPGEEYYVTVSGRSGKIVGARHPSAVKATFAKLRKLITP